MTFSTTRRTQRMRIPHRCNNVIIGERERRTTGTIFLYISRSLRAPIPNKSNVNVILQYWMQCACAVVARHVRALHLYYSWRCAYYSWQLYLFVNNLYIQVLASAFCQLLYHFLPYITWIAPARQQCSTFC